MEVPFADLEEGKKYKLRDHFTLTVEQEGYGTLQEDIDLLANGFYELTEIYNLGGSVDATFRLPPGQTVHIPAVPNSNQRENIRDYIQLSSEALPDGEETIFLELNDPQENIQAPTQTNLQRNNATNALINNGTQSAGKRRSYRKKRKTVKKKSKKSKSRKARKSRRV
jgi:hypothetical protein